MYSKIPEQVRSKMKKEESTTSSVERPVDVGNVHAAMITQNSERLTNIEKEIQTLQNIPRVSKQMTNELLEQVNMLIVKQDENHRNQVNTLKNVNSKLEEIKNIIKQNNS